MLLPGAKPETGSALLPGKQQVRPLLTCFLSDPTFGIPGCTGVLFNHREWGVSQSFVPWSLMMEDLFGDEGNMVSNSLRPRTALIQLSLIKGSHHVLLITKALIAVAATSCFKWCLLCFMRSLTQKRARGTASSQYLSRDTCQVTLKSLK